MMNEKVLTPITDSEISQENLLDSLVHDAQLREITELQESVDPTAELDLKSPGLTDKEDELKFLAEEESQISAFIVNKVELKE